MAVPITLDLGPPPRTIYRDILNLPDPTLLGCTSRIFNDDTVGLYFRLTGSGPAGWAFTTVDIGLIAAGANVYRNFDNFASRTKPAAELTESIDFILRAYTDAGYTNLKWTYTRTVSVVWIKSDDPSYTVDVLNNFDDGTVQGWAVANETGNSTGYPTLTVVTTYYLSPPYSARMWSRPAAVGEVRSRLYKSFTTPNKDVIYAIMDMRYAERVGYEDSMWLKNVQVQRNGNILVFLGRPYDTASAHYLPKDRWVRIVVPLPKNTTLELRIVPDIYCDYTASWGDLWLDDFKIISK